MTQAERTIVVRGVGRASRRPDQATIHFTAETTAASARDAQAEASRRMTTVLSTLAARGIDPGDVATRSISLDPVWDHREETPRLLGHRASQTVAVRVRDLERLGPVIDACVEAGASGLGGVSLELADPREAMDEARTAAVTDARARAATLAAAAGGQLGPLLSLREGAQPSGPRPMFRMAAEMAMDTPVAEGSTEVEVEVEATFALT